MSIGLRILSRDTAQYRVQDIVEIHRLFPYGENYVLMIQGIFGEDPIEYVQCHCSSMDTIFLQHPELTAIYQAYTAHVIQEKKQYQTKKFWCVIACLLALVGIYIFILFFSIFRNLVTLALISSILELALLLTFGISCHVWLPKLMLEEHIQRRLQVLHEEMLEQVRNFQR
ncbi:hypothetical protein [uncultured Ruminococcus sp.]|uniref:hypothetical protein n=1 Tax=uncultured Ruminococcus sp. TaxID=165186 RepID=UPI002676CFD6|nr:hypothetical protein [uncultured Ruminococcus sp.]